MKCFTDKHESTGLYQFEVIKNREDFSQVNKVFLLLHGYSETGFKVYKRLGHKIAQAHPDALILAPNGLYPIPQNFPLESNKKEDLLKGYAWYFYHAATNQFLIDYKVPAQTLAQWLKSFTDSNNLSHCPLEIIGYSQGGYLAPFLAETLDTPPDRVIGVNCSYREDRLKDLPTYPLYQIQGRDDTIIDTQLCHQRFINLKERGLVKGEFIWLEKEDHKLTSTVAERVLELIATPY